MSAWKQIPLTDTYTKELNAHTFSLMAPFGPVIGRKSNHFCLKHLTIDVNKLGSDEISRYQAEEAELLSPKQLAQYAFWEAEDPACWEGRYPTYLASALAAGRLAQEFNHTN